MYFISQSLKSLFNSHNGTVACEQIMNTWPPGFRISSSCFTYSGLWDWSRQCIMAESRTESKPLFGSESFNASHTRKLALDFSSKAFLFGFLDRFRRKIYTQNFEAVRGDKTCMKTCTTAYIQDLPL